VKENYKRNAQTIEIIVCFVFQHFRALAEDNKLDNAIKNDYGEDQGPDRFVL